MRKGWQTVKLGEVAEITMGQSPKGEYLDIGGQYLFLQGCSEFTMKYPKIIRNSSVMTRQANKGDILLSVRAPVGMLNIAPCDNICIGRGLAGIRATHCDHRFLYYVLKNSQHIWDIHNSTGTVFGNINRDSLKSHECVLPPLKEQERIASILSAFDDKIEVNNKICKDLEALAKLLFNKNFTANPDKDSWPVAKLGEVGQVITGKTPSTERKDFYGGNVPFITIPDMHNNIFILKSERYLSSEGVANQANKLLPENTIITSCIATVGLVSITTQPSQTNQQINALILKESIYLYYTYHYICTLKEHLKNLGSAGTTTYNVNKGTFENIILPLPPAELLAEFEAVVAPLFAQIKNLQQQNASLASTRDLLLPRLMKGEV